MTIGQIDIEILDRMSNGLRAISDLESRQAYLDGAVSPSVTTTLSSSITRSQTGAIQVASTAGFPSSGVIHISQECLHYTSTDSTHFTIDAAGRGYLLSDAVSHGANVKVYSFLPSLFRRVGYLFKGYQSLPLDKWARMIGGPITEDFKEEALVKLTLMSQTWETFHRVADPFTGSPTFNPKMGQLGADLLGNDYQNVNLTVAGGIGNLNNGHYIGVVAGEVVAVRGAV